MQVFNVIFMPAYFFLLVNARIYIVLG